MAQPAGHARGGTLIYTLIAMVGLSAFCSLGVDWGRVRLVKAELSTAADASAHAAVQALAGGSTSAQTRNVAIAIAQANTADGSPVAMQASDVRIGYWDGTTFTNNGSPANAVETTALRTSARGTAVALSFGRVIGMSTFDVRVTAIAAITSPTPTFGIFGINSVTMTGNIQTDSYDSSVAAYASAYSPDKGNVGTNGTMSADGNIVIRGDARRASGSPTLTGGATATGSTTAFDTPQAYPNASSDGYSYSTNDNASLPGANRPGQDFNVTDSVTINVPAGHYYFRNFNWSNAQLNVTGEAVIYVNGYLFIDNDARTSSHRPKNLTFKVIGSGKVDIWGNYGVWADIYAPQSDVEFKSNKHLYGRVVGKTVKIDSDCQVHYDESLGAAAGTSRITLVR